MTFGWSRPATSCQPATSAAGNVVSPSATFARQAARMCCAAIANDETGATETVSGLSRKAGAETYSYPVPQSPLARSDPSLQKVSHSPSKAGRSRTMPCEEIVVRHFISRQSFRHSPAPNRIAVSMSSALASPRSSIRTASAMYGTSLHSSCHCSVAQRYLGNPQPIHYKSGRQLTSCPA